jgi:hypothetical protein
MHSADEVAQASLMVIRTAGRGQVRRRLEVLVNTGILGLEGAQKVYRDAFGGRLKAVKPTTHRWFHRD